MHIRHPVQLLTCIEIVSELEISRDMVNEGARQLSYRENRPGGGGGTPIKSR